LRYFFELLFVHFEGSQELVDDELALGVGVTLKPGWDNQTSVAGLMRQ